MAELAVRAKETEIELFRGQQLSKLGKVKGNVLPPTIPKPPAPSIPKQPKRTP